MGVILTHVGIWITVAVLLALTVHFNEKVEDIECEFHVVKKKLDDLIKNFERLAPDEKFDSKRTAIRVKIDKEVSKLDRIKKTTKKMKILRFALMIADILFAIFTATFYKLF